MSYDPKRYDGPNRYGVDIGYFGTELDKLRDSLPNRPPKELARYLHTLGNILAPDDAVASLKEQVRVLEEYVRVMREMVPCNDLARFDDEMGEFTQEALTGGKGEG